MRRFLEILPVAAVLLMLGPAVAAGSVPSASDPAGRAATAAVDRRAGQAEIALAQVRELLGDRGFSSRSAAGAPERDLTMALRDLVALRGSLSPADRAEADAYLARPTHGRTDPMGNGYTTTEEKPACGAHVCVHYVKTTADAATPEFVALALETLEHVHTTFTSAGYRPPKPDGAAGGDALTDVYLADIGASAYGYCTTDDPHSRPSSTYKFYDMSAYCVLDNDYAAQQFPNHTPRENLEVTAAHEYFHAVQFAYDYLEDFWLMEGTATWMEDEVYDTIDDNRQFLRESPLAQPSFPLDNVAGSHEYGAWIFFRHLSERFPSEAGGLPTIVRDIWRKADADFDGPDQFSAQAVRSRLAALGTTFPAAFARFGAVNRHPGRSYEEGAAYSPAPLHAGWGLSTTRRSTGWRSATLNHMANATVRIKPATTLKASDWRLRLNLDLPLTSRGSAATVQVYLTNGSIRVSPLTLNADGDATRTFPFTIGSVRYVEVTLTNASTRFACWQDTLLSCQGRPLDNGRVFAYRATAYRS